MAFDYLTDGNDRREKGKVILKIFMKSYIRRQSRCWHTETQIDYGGEKKNKNVKRSRSRRKEKDA